MSNLNYDLDKRRYPSKQKRGVLRFLYYLRKAQSTNNRIMKKIYRIFMKPYQKIYGLEISDKLKVGGDFILDIHTISQLIQNR